MSVVFLGTYNKWSKKLAKLYLFTVSSKKIKYVQVNLKKINSKLIL